MPRLIIAEGAVAGLERCRLFLEEHSPAASQRAARAITAGFAALAANPNIGRPFDLAEGLRLLSISFGDAGYVALYRYDPDADTVTVLAFRHQREAGFY